MNLFKFFNEKPDITDILERMTPDAALHYTLCFGINESCETILGKEAWSAYNYVRRVSHKRFIEAEAVISKHPWYGYLYEGLLEHGFDIP